MSATIRGLAAIDVGCGGGILAESMAAKGAQVTGIDLADKPLKVAELHALDADLTPERLPDADTSAIDLDHDAAGAEEDGSATKIELARAYLDIGDVDGARGMLEEVLAEGGPRGRAEASQLLKEIG